VPASPPPRGALAENAVLAENAASWQKTRRVSPRIDRSLLPARLDSFPAPRAALDWHHFHDNAAVRLRQLPVQVHFLACRSVVTAHAEADQDVPPAAHFSAAPLDGSRLHEDDGGSAMALRERAVEDSDGMTPYCAGRTIGSTSRDLPSSTGGLSPQKTSSIPSSICDW